MEEYHSQVNIGTICPVCDEKGNENDNYKNIFCIQFKNSILNNLTSIVIFDSFLAPEGRKHTPHYGGICCYSCRAFFRRAHTNSKNPKFICRTAPDSSNVGLKDQCGYDVQTKRQCQFHRLKTCIEIGALFSYAYF